MAYPGGGWQGGKGAQSAGPPVGQRGPEAEAGLAAEDLAWLQKNLGADSGAGQYALSLLCKGCHFRCMYVSHSTKCTKVLTD